MNVTITVTTGSGADVEISQDRPEIRSMSSGDFDARLIAEVLDSVVERVRRSYGITPTSHDPAVVVAGDDNERLDG
jgi:hypothetical protein